MIQRIQTVYLLLAAALMAALFLPVFEFASIKPEAKAEGLFADGVFNTFDSQLLLILTIGIVAIALIDIFMYKNRKIQLLLTRLTIILILTLIIIAGYLFYSNAANFNEELANVSIRLGLIVPVVSIILLFLAAKHILKDEKIVRSMDRLR